MTRIVCTPEAAALFSKMLEQEMVNGVLITKRVTNFMRLSMKLNYNTFLDVLQQNGMLHPDLMNKVFDELDTVSQAHCMIAVGALRGHFEAERL